MIPHLQPTPPACPRNTILTGDCTTVLPSLPSGSADLILTDPPYLVRYRDRNGRRIANDDNDAWLDPAATEMYRVLKPAAYCVSFYGWTQADRFLAAWRAAGFRTVGHLVFRKRYASADRHLRAHHEQAYLLAKGRPTPPAKPIPDVIDFPYSGNRYHPTQKPIAPLRALIESFSQPNDLILDPFCGAGSTLLAAQASGRAYLGIELSPAYCDAASHRLGRT